MKLRYAIRLVGYSSQVMQRYTPKEVAELVYELLSKEVISDIRITVSRNADEEKS